MADEPSADEPQTDILSPLLDRAGHLATVIQKITSEPSSRSGVGFKKEALRALQPLAAELTAIASFGTLSN